MEPCIGLICACLPIIRGLLPAFTPKRTTARPSEYYGSGTRRGPHHDPLRSGKPDQYMEMDSSRNGSPLRHYDIEGGYEHKTSLSSGDIHVRTTVAVN